MSSPFWNCPVCHQALRPAQGGDRCDNGHCFDHAREGYVNLLLAHQRRSRMPGDSKDMLQNRRLFLEQGHYRVLADGLARLVLEDCTNNPATRYAWLDAGCGEGHYTGHIQHVLETGCPRQVIEGGGIDISRYAIRMAARRYHDIRFAVAGNTALPVPARSLNAMLRIFVPGKEIEAMRVLRPGGLFITVRPGPRHLFALRRMIYDSPREHEAHITPVEGLRHERRIQLEGTLVITGEDVTRLFSMTPYYWRASEDRQLAIQAIDRLETEFSFLLDCYRSPSR